MKNEYAKFAMNNYVASQALHNNNLYHSSVYLGGYVLEGYLKTLLCIAGLDPGSLDSHNCSNYYQQIGRSISLFPQNFSVSDFISFISPTSSLLGGAGQNNPKWHPVKRYDTSKWTEKSFSNKIQNEIGILNNKILQLKTTGLL